MSDEQPSPRRRPLWRRRWFLVTTAVVVVIGVVIGVGLWWYLRDDAPPEVTLDAAVDAARGDDAQGDTAEDGDDGSGDVGGDGASAAGDPEDGDSRSEGGTPAGDDGTSAGSGDDGNGDATSGGGDGAGTGDSGTNPAEGTWTVDPTLGEFSFDDATGSFAGFRVEEELAAIGSTTAVGRTPAVEGTIEIDGTTLVAAEVVADMTEIVTNDSRRDSAVQRALDTDDFPTATFVLSEPVQLGEAAPTGVPVAVEAPGTLTIHGVSREVAIPIEAQLVDGERIALVGSIPVVFADYDVETPSAAIVLSVQDDGIMEFQLLLTRP